MCRARRVLFLRSGNKKYRALRLDAGNFSWSSEGVTRKTRVIDVMYCAGNAEHVRTKTLTKGVVVAIDATPFRQYYAAQYAQILGAKKGKAISPTDQAEVDKKRSKHLAVRPCFWSASVLVVLFCQGHVAGRGPVRAGCLLWPTGSG